MDLEQEIVRLHRIARVLEQSAGRANTMPEAVEVIMAARAARLRIYALTVPVE